MGKTMQLNYTEQCNEVVNTLIRFCLHRQQKVIASKRSVNELFFGQATQHMGC